MNLSAFFLLFILAVTEVCNVHVLRFNDRSYWTKIRRRD